MSEELIKLKSITNGKYKIIFSKRLVLVSDDPLEIVFDLSGELNLVLRFSFEEKKEDKPSFAMNSIPVDKGFGYHFILYNFSNSIGTGLVEPIPLISHNVDGTEKNVCISFFAQKIGKARPIIDAALYEEI
ncbi:MAG: hypothetical protein K5765_03645 [Clostridia bacterium]|nr:hypothetical protein [Clostridia bacterium]